MTDARDADAQMAHVGEAGTREHAPTSVGHEARDVRIRPIVIAFAILLVVAILVHGLMYVVLDRFTARDLRRSEPASPLAAYGRQAPPAPRLQVAPRDDLQRLRAREEALLHGYAWVDRGAGVTRIPIDRAMELLAARGLPATGTAAPAPRSLREGATR